MFFLLTVLDIAVVLPINHEWPSRNRGAATGKSLKSPIDEQLPTYEGSNWNFAIYAALLL